jgi:hypothetical protein
MRELFPQVTRCIPLEQVGDHRRTKPRRRTHKHMDMIHIRFQCEKRQPVPITTFRDESLCLSFYLSGQDLSSVFGYPDQVVPNHVVGPSGFTHL